VTAWNRDLACGSMSRCGVDPRYSFPMPRRCSTLFLAILSALPAAAQGLGPEQFFLLAEQSRTAFTVLGAGARANGAGGAFIAVADDATASSFNPAGLAKLLHPECSLALERVEQSQDFTGFSSETTTGEPIEYRDTGNALNRMHPTFVSWAMPWKSDGKARVFEISYQRMFDMGHASKLSYSARNTETGKLQLMDQTVNQSGGIGVYSAALGFELSPRFLAGASLNLWSGSWAFSSESSLVTSTSSTTYVSTLAQSSEFRGLNASFGLIWRSEHIQIGTIYRTPFEARYTFENRYSHPDGTSGQLLETSSPRTTYGLRWPETFGWGIAVHPAARFQVAADWSWTPWSRSHFVAPGTNFDGLNFFDFKGDTSTRNVTDARIGCEWIAVLGDRVIVPIRFGVFREPQPIVDTRTLQQRIFRGFTIGAGLKIGSLVMDLAYHGAKSYRDVSRYTVDAPSGGFSTVSYGREVLNEKRLLLSVTGRIPDETMRKALSWFFIGDR